MNSQQPSSPSSFVFHDPAGQRWVRFWRFVKTAALLFFLAIAIFAVAAISLPQLTVLGLPAAAPANAVEGVNLKGKNIPKNAPFRLAKPAKPLRYVHSLSPVLHPRKAAAPASAAQPLVWGFYVNWDPASMVSLRLHLHHLTHLIPEWLVLQNNKGDIDDQTDATVTAIANQANLPIYAMLTNYRQDWQPADVEKIIRSADRRADLIENIRANLAEHKFAGVMVDFESLKPRDREPWLAFMRQLTETLHKSNYVVSEAVPVDDSAYDLPALAGIVDYLAPMVYDEHYQTGEPGPVASETFFENELEKLTKVGATSKLVIAFGNYGYDWTIGEQGGAETAFSDVMTAAAETKKPVVWDAGTGNPVLRYSAAGAQHEIWFLDAVSALNQVQAVHDNGFRGVALWRLGAEDPGLWRVLEPNAWPANPFDASSLTQLQADQAAPRQFGRGEIISVAETPHSGARTVTAPKTQDDDFSEDYKTYPTPFVINHTGATAQKLLCLTFDDGPDKEFTPQVLDILKRYQAPAAFFVVGVNAERFPGLIQREYAEGHEIGNHTYTHPNIATTSALRTQLELSTTQRIIENLLGVSTTFFRPPYNADSAPTTPQEIEPILRAQQFGYATIAETIDPRDWQPGVTVDAILQETENEVAEAQAENDADAAHIILLHDAGGNRAATVAALPKLIERFRAKGYRFGAVGDLLGKTRQQVMPRASAEEMRLARIEGGGLDSKARFGQVLGVLFLSAIFLTLARSLAYGVLALLQKIRTAGRRFDPQHRPPVSVLVAAYNEEKVIARTIDSLLANGYGDMEIVVVDDGSKDRTLEVLREQFAQNPKVAILTQPNGGKSAALNNAIRHARNEILVAVDADTLFAPGAIEKLARHFADERVAAVSGNARVGNKHNWITRFQSIEYIYGFNLDRRALDYLNAITVVPGAVGAWRKTPVLAAGGFLHDTLAEDTDLTLTLRRAGHIIRYEEGAIAYTEAPEDTKSLLKQRFRWVFGTLQASWKHRDALFVPKYGTLGFVALPSIWLFQLVLAMLAPFAEIAMIVSLIEGAWKIVLLYYAAFFVVELLSGFFAYALEGLPPWDLSLLLFQSIYYRQIMLFVLGKSFLFAVRGRLVGWGKLERKATVTAQG